MSIAVSTVVYPSRIHSMLIGAMALIAAVVAFVVAFGHLGDLSLSIRGLISSLLFFLASFGFYHGMASRKTIQLDISGIGQIRLLTLEGNRSCSSKKRPHVTGMGDLVRLMDNSTIWTCLLLLRLQSEDGRMTVVPIFPDSVDRESFRALSVACRWISVRNETQCPEIF
ncbi:protein YgfX [Noviherbaspirillum denitrificans]|uniref:Flagellar hook-length control protein n=1 Tax=Noviherbaspirillum denitrificans TaxID=1968433 RepID=A0A254TIA9_9BURK|nr:protein YgfX [Noviherbaspirillum denitrificans]OWW19418.1 hypothetical protein AYR66_07745 [Noviherbaspirillum denitrificans]